MCSKGTSCKLTLCCHCACFSFIIFRQLYVATRAEVRYFAQVASFVMTYACHTFKTRTLLLYTKCKTFNKRIGYDRLMLLFASIIESANYASLDENDTEPNLQNQNNPPTSGIWVVRVF